MCNWILPNIVPSPTKWWGGRGDGEGEGERGRNVENKFVSRKKMKNCKPHGIIGMNYSANHCVKLLYVDVYY